MDLNLIYVGYACTAINYAFYCVSRFKEDKRDILFLDLIAKIFTVIGLYCLDSLSGAYSMCLMFLICIACYIKQCKNWKLTPLFWLFQILFIIILYKTYIGVFSVLVFISS